MHNTTPPKKNSREFTLVIEAPKYHLPVEMARRMRTKTQPLKGKKRSARVNQKKEW